MSKRPCRIIWVIVDGLGYQLASACIERGMLPALAQMRDKYYLGALEPSGPNCQTPPALYALFSGTQSAENGIWGFTMPDYEGQLAHTASGFGVAPLAGEPLWAEAERHRIGYTLVNAAFRKDPVWHTRIRHAQLLFDGYRNLGARWKTVDLRQRARQPFQFCGIQLGASFSGKRLLVHKAGRCLAALAPGSVAAVKITKSLQATLLHAADRSLYLFPHYRPHVLLPASAPDAAGPRASGADRTSAEVDRALPIPVQLTDGVIFRHVRELTGGQQREGDIPIDDEIRVAQTALDDVSRMCIAAARHQPSRLFVFYLALLDDVCHAYLDQIQEDFNRSPTGATGSESPGVTRGTLLLQRVVQRIDTFLGTLLDVARTATDTDDVVVVTSDHGQIPYRRKLAINELFRAQGLLKHGRDGPGYRFERAAAYYHPSNCGQVVVNHEQARRKGFSRQGLQRAVGNIVTQANREYGAQLAYVLGDTQVPYLAFLYPTGDTLISGAPPDSPASGASSAARAFIQARSRGGHHLSPLCGSPWISALLGVWCSAPDRLPARLPQRGAEVRDLLLELLLG